MAKSIKELWPKHPATLHATRHISDEAWRLLVGYVVPELLTWFGNAGMVVSKRRNGNPVDVKDLEAAIEMVAFLPSPEAWKDAPDCPFDLKQITSILQAHKVIDKENQVSERARELLGRLAGKATELVILQADHEARAENASTISNRHIIRGCERFPYPLDLIC